MPPPGLRRRDDAGCGGVEKGAAILDTSEHEGYALYGGAIGAKACAAGLKHSRGVKPRDERVIT